MIILYRMHTKTPKKTFPSQSSCNPLDAIIFSHVHKTTRPLPKFRAPKPTQQIAHSSETTDLNYWIKHLSCIIEANGGHIGLSHINLHWYYWGSRRGFYRFRLLVGMDKHCVNEISFTNNFCFFLNLPVNNELGIVQDGRHEFIIKCFKPSQNH